MSCNNKQSDKTTNKEEYEIPHINKYTFRIIIIGIVLIGTILVVIHVYSDGTLQKGYNKSLQAYKNSNLQKGVGKGFHKIIKFLSPNLQLSFPVVKR